MTTTSHDDSTAAGTLLDDHASRSEARITLISGTNRPGSATREITDILAAFYTALQQEVRILDLVDLPLEVFAPSSYSRKPESFHRFAASVLEADGIHIVTPEYNGGPPGVLKHFIDLLPYPQAFRNRPVCFTGLAAGQWGALRPVEQLQLILGYGKALVFPERVFLPSIRAATSRKGPVVDEENEKRLMQQAGEFAAFVRRIAAEEATTEGIVS